MGVVWWVVVEEIKGGSMPEWTIAMDDRLLRTRVQVQEPFREISIFRPFSSSCLHLGPVVPSTISGLWHASQRSENPNEQQNWRRASNLRRLYPPMRMKMSIKLTRRRIVESTRRDWKNS